MEESNTVLTIALVITIVIVIYFVRDRNKISSLALKVAKQKNHEINNLKQQIHKLNGIQIDQDLRNTDLKSKITNILDIDLNSDDDMVVHTVETLKNSNEAKRKNAKRVTDKWIIKLSKGDTDQVLNELIEYTKNSSNGNFLQEAIQYSNRWNLINKLMDRGTIKLEEYNLEASRINSALIKLIDGISNH